MISHLKLFFCDVVFVITCLSLGIFLQKLLENIFRTFFFHIPSLKIRPGAENCPKKLQTQKLNYLETLFLDLLPSL